MNTILDALVWALVRLGYGTVAIGEFLDWAFLNRAADRILDLIEWLEEKRGRDDDT